MEVEKTPLKDCYIIKPKVFKDNRGSFFESYNHIQFTEKTGLKIDFVQDNQSISQKGTLRGFHFQTGDHHQSKLVRVVTGEVLDVVVDLRKESPSFKKSFSIKLDDKVNYQLFVPRGFAHAFLTLSETAIFSYKCDNYYHKPSERGIIYNDKSLAIDWGLPEEQLILSEKDKVQPTLEEYLAE